MTNLAHLLTLPLEEFAALLVYFEDEFICSADGQRWLDYESALNRTVNWLQEEHKEIAEYMEEEK